MNKLLIVDDNQFDLNMLETLLKGNGYVVTTARNGIEALEQLRRAPHDLIISDILMPDMDGFSLCRALKKDAALKNIPFIFYTATYTHPRDEEFALRLGAEKFILKPTDPEELIAILRTIIKKCEAGQMASATIELEEETVYYQRYNEALIRKLEDKMVQIELINSALEQDISERKRVEEDLRSRNRELSLLTQVIEQTVENVIITDTEGVIVYVNPPFEQLTGYSKYEAIGHTPSILNSGEQDISFFQELWATIKKGKIWRGNIVNKKKDGSRYIDKVAIIPVRDVNGKIINYAGIQQDITYESNLEEQYRQMQKMDAIGQLTAGIAHDFNNILTAINGNAELLQMQITQDDTRYKFINNILYSGEKAANLIQQLLTFSRKQVIEPRVLNLNKCIDGMGKMLQHLIGENIEMKTVIAPELWMVKVDPTQIEQVIINLAVNARDAMPGGGQLSIETANVVLDEGYVPSHLEATPGDYVMLTVSDSGCGMNKETLARVFEPFFSTKGLGKGTGLGLATVFGIVKQSGGNIWVYSEEGKGTSFKIYLPRVVELLQELPEKTAAGIELPNGDETILLAEDNESVRQLTRQILEAQGYKVLEAQNGEDALQLANRHSGNIHLLLTDVIMPGMSGKILSEHLRRQRPDINILFMSGYSADMMGLQIIKASQMPFIQKPFSTSQLLYKVRGVLDASTSLSR